jgi:enoyl-CoA hydratase/carnithine racemase
MTDFTQYSNAYRHTRFERRDGILQIQIHRDGGSAVWDASPGGIHAELGNVFYQVGRDRENQVVILTGTGDEFLTQMDLSAVQEINTQYWDRIYKEGKDLRQICSRSRFQ